MTLVIRGGWLVLLIGMLGASPIEATLVVELDLPELTERAELIVQAEATDSESLRLEGTLFTLVRLQVYRELKGQAGDEVHVLLPGGVDVEREVPVATIWAGQPRLDVDRTYLLFLQRPDPSEPYHTLVGFSQGRFEIRYDEEGQAFAVQDLRGLSRRGPDGDTPGRRTLQPLDRIRAEIRRAVSAVDGDETARQEVP